MWLSLYPFPPALHAYYLCVMCYQTIYYLSAHVCLIILSPALPNVLNLKFDPINNALICTSTHSPATTVTWMRDGHPLTIDGTTYQLMQTVTNRRESTYENVLTINDQLSSVGHIFRCTVINVLGSSSEELQALGKNTIKVYHII